MSIPTPPLPPKSVDGTTSQSFEPRVGAPNVVLNADLGNPRSASVLPVLMAVIATVLSLALAVLGNAPLQSLTGYFLTPMSVAACLAWDNLSQRRGMQDVWFSPRPRYSLILRVFIAASFLLAYPHIHELSSLIAERLTAGVR